MSMFDKLCLSGGAEGADLQWGMCAGKAGHSVLHFIFQGHRSKAPKEELVVLTNYQLLWDGQDEETRKSVDEYLARANETLKRRWPVQNDFVASLLRRNYYQVAHADAVYAVSSIDKNGLVKGGTAWAVQMFIDRFNGGVCDAYVFDQDENGWFTWDGSLGWSDIIEPPTPSRVWAGIGSRELKENGKNAIRSLLNYASTKE